MMAIVNRTPDSFYDKGATWAEEKAFERVVLVEAQGRSLLASVWWHWRSCWARQPADFSAWAWDFLA